MFQNFLQSQNVSPVTQCLIAAAAALVCSLLLGMPVRSLGVWLKIMDVPNFRSSHTRVVPRMGGVSIILAMCGTIALFGTLTTPLLLVAAFGAAISAVSFIDDWKSLSTLKRLAVHVVVVAASVFVLGLPFTGLGLPYLPVSLPSWAGLIVAVLFAGGFLNAFNFMDGINGNAAAQGIVGGATLAVLLVIPGANNSAIVAAALVGACLGFLPYNFPRAVMFLGDVGSTTIGFVLAMMVLLASKHWPLVACVLPLALFIYDPIFTMVKRLLNGEKAFREIANRQHHYQLLVRSGWSHVRVTSLQCVMMLLCGAASLTYALVDDSLVRLLVLVTLSAVLATYSILVHRHFARHGKKEERCA